MLSKLSKYAVWCVLILLMLCKVINLNTDPPLYHTGHGQAQLTDPYHLTFHARNDVLYDDWNPFDYNRWDVFKNSLISGISYLVFSVSGVSRAAANLSAVLLHCGGILLFIFGFLKYRDRWELALTALFLLINNSLFFYGRLPFLENGLIFLAGLLFFVFIRYHDRFWGQLLSGVLIALAALSGKLFGFILIGPVLFIIINKYRNKALIPALLIISGIVAGAGLYVLVFYGGSLSTMMSYYSEQTVGMYGAPPGFSSVGNFIKMFVTYGGISGLWQFNPFFLFLTGLSFVLVPMIIPIKKTFDAEYLPIVFCVVWLISGVFGLMPFQYRPLRYALFLILPASTICAFVIRTVFEKKIRLGLYHKWISLPLIYGGFLYLLVQTYILFGPVGMKFKTGEEALLPMAFVSLIVIGVIFLGFRRNRGISSRRWLFYPLGALVLAVIVLQGSYIYRGLIRPGNYLQQYNKELSQIIDNGAVITGPYAPALTIDNELKGIIYVFGLSNVEKDIFAKFPITHIVSDVSNWRRALKDYPFLKSASLVAQMVVRDQVVGLYRLPGVDLPLTDFEQGEIFLSGRQLDSALIHFTRFSNEYPQNLLGKTHLATALLANNNQSEAIAILDSLLDEYPNNYLIQAYCTGFYTRLYNATKEDKYSQRVRYHEQKAISLNPAIIRAR